MAWFIWKMRISSIAEIRNCNEFKNKYSPTNEKQKIDTINNDFVLCLELLPGVNSLSFFFHEHNISTCNFISIQLKFVCRYRTTLK